LMRDNAELLGETQNRRIQLEEDLLVPANIQKQQVDAQFADMKANKERAEKAVSDGNMVLVEAQDTLRTLYDFENSVNDNKQAAQEAFEKYEEIDETARNAYRKAAEAKEAMKGADTSANLALTVALDAQTISSEASTAAASISQVAMESRGLAEELANDAESLTVKIQETKEKLDDKEKTAELDGEDAHKALEKANKAQHKAMDSSKKVIEAQKELNEIATILSTVEEPEPGLLEELERRVADAEEKFQAADLDIKLQELEAAKQRQAEMVRDMIRELDYMTEEVQSNKEKADSMPNFCPTNNELCMENNC